MAPTLATLVLGFLEEIMHKRTGEKHGQEFSTFLRNDWKRFLDDCFIIWNNDFDIGDFFRDLNNLHRDINFTMDSSDISIPFLDVLENKVTCDLYSKPTDTHNYLNFRSCHPKHTKLNIPFSLASRIVTIVTDKTLQTQRLDELFTYLKHQGYPEELIHNGILRAKEKGPIKGDNRKSEGNEKVIPCVTTFNPRNTNIFPVVRACEQLFLRKSDKMKHFLDKKPIINSKRQPKNLKRILSSSKFDFTESKACVKKCGKCRCKTCPIINEGQSLTFGNGKTFTVKHDMDCDTKNVINALICQNCDKFYIGQTSIELRKRMTLHRQQTVRDEFRVLKVNKHVHECADDKFKVVPFYKVLNNNASLRDEKERYLINTLKPELNSSV